MAALTASPGAWVTVPIPAGSWPVTMQIGDAEPAPAFVDNRRGRRGQTETVASRRCPNLRPGRYSVRVTAGSVVVQEQLTIV